MLSERIKQIENSISPESYLYKNNLIWPYIRISLHLSAKKGSDAGESTSILRKMLFVLLGFLEFLKWKIGRWKKVDNLFLSSGHYKVKDGKFYRDRIIDPFLNFLAKNNQSYAVLEFTSTLGYRSDLSYNNRIIKIQPVLYFLSFMWRVEFMLFKTKIKDSLKGDYILLNELIKANAINWRFDDKSVWRLFLLEKQRIIFENLLISLKVKKAGVVCYYDFKSLAFVSACNRVNIPVIDFQHGVQGPQHMAYSNWPKDLVKESDFLPSHFWVWDEFSYNTIGKWKNHSKILLGCNKWFWDKVILDSPEVILFSIQPIKNPIPDFLFEVIRKYSGDKKWYFRLHPQQLGQLDKFKELIKAKGLENIINIEQASLLPLTELLPKTLVHLTFYSSVTIESSYYYIPTIFLDERGLRYYGDQLIENLIFAPVGSTEILKCINSIEGKVFNQSELINTFNILNRFKIIDRFFE